MKNATLLFRLLFVTIVFVLLLSALLTACTEKAKTTATAELTLNAPDSLDAARTETGSAALGWTDNTNNEAGFVIERSTVNASEGFHQISVTAANAISFVDSLAPIDSICYYRVCAYLLSIRSSFSNVANVPSNSRPGAVQYESPSNGTTNTALGVDLRWSAAIDPEADPVLYDVHLMQDTQPLFDSIMGFGITDTHYQTGRLALSTTYRWQVVAYDQFHQPPAINLTEGYEFTTGNNQASYLGWNEIPHTGQVTLYGNYDEYSSWWQSGGGHGGNSDHFADTLSVAYQAFLLPTANGGELSFGGIQLATFPLIATNEIIGVTTPSNLDSFFSNSLLYGSVYRNRQIFAEDLMIGTTTLHCSVVKFWHSEGSGGYGLTLRDSLQLFFSQGIGLVKVVVYHYGSFESWNGGSVIETGTTYTITEP